MLPIRRKKRSPIWKLPKSDLTLLVSESNTFSSILRFFGLKNIGGNTATLRRRLDEEGISYSHIKRGLASNIGRVFIRKDATPIENLLVKGSTVTRHVIKRRIINDGVLKKMCGICALNDEWNGKPLVLVLDHINGDSTDYRLSNLRLLCPNCNSQTETFSGRNARVKLNCNKCGRETKKGSKTGLCVFCAHLAYRKVKDRPSIEIVIKEVEEVGFCAVGRKYGVSDNAVRKWIRSKTSMRP